MASCTPLLLAAQSQRLFYSEVDITIFAKHGRHVVALMEVKSDDPPCPISR